MTARVSKGADDYRLVTLWVEERIKGQEEVVEEQFASVGFQSSPATAPETSYSYQQPAVNDDNLM